MTETKFKIWEKGEFEKAHPKVDINPTKWCSKCGEPVHRVQEYSTTTDWQCPKCGQVRSTLELGKEVLPQAGFAGLPDSLQPKGGRP